MYLPGMPYHVVQRGNNREACFIEPENYQYYLELWKTISRRYHNNREQTTVYTETATKKPCPA